MFFFLFLFFIKTCSNFISTQYHHLWMFFQHFHWPVLASSIICTSVCRPFWLVAFPNNTKSTRNHLSTVTYFCELRALLRVIHHLPSQNVSLECFFKNQNDPVFYLHTSTGLVYLQIHQNPKLIWKYEVEGSNLFKEIFVFGWTFPLRPL